MNSNVDEEWEAFLNPDVLRPRLAQAAIFIVAFEMLKATIVDRIRSFFSVGFDSERDRASPEYANILARNRSPVHASLDWLVEQGAINAGDRLKFDDIKACRNRIAHELLEVMSKGLPPEFDAQFGELVALLRKIEVWWILDVDVATDPRFDGQTIDEGGIVPGPIWGLQLLYEIALGSPERSRFYYEEFRKRTKPTDV